MVCRLILVYCFCSKFIESNIELLSQSSHINPPRNFSSVASSLGIIASDMIHRSRFTSLSVVFCFLYLSPSKIFQSIFILYTGDPSTLLPFFCLDSVNSLQIQDTKINLHTNISSLETPTERDLISSLQAGNNLSQLLYLCTFHFPLKQSSPWRYYFNIEGETLMGSLFDATLHRGRFK